jgi:hypothetical protein
MGSDSIEFADASLAPVPMRKSIESDPIER